MANILTNPIYVIPAYKPDSVLMQVVKELSTHPAAQIVVVNDGSPVQFDSLFEEIKQFSATTVLTHAINLGKGAALKTAFNHILVNYKTTVGAVTVDADGQHSAQDVKAVSNQLLNKPNALILGARQFSQVNVPLRSAFGNKMTKLVFRALLGKKLTDTQTGLRGVPRQFMAELLPLTTNRYEFELDMLIQCQNRHREILEVPIETIYIDENSNSHFNPFLDSFRIYFLFLRFALSSLMTYISDIASFTLFYSMSHQMTPSFVIGRTVGLFVSFYLSREFVFKSGVNVALALTKIVVLWIVLMGLSYSLMNVLIVRFGFGIYSSRLVVDPVLFIANFLIQRDLIFKPRFENREQYSLKEIK